VVSAFQLQVGVGVIVAFSVGAAAQRLAAGEAVWKWTLGVGAVPAIVLLLLIPFISKTKPQFSEVDRDQTPFKIRPSLVPQVRRHQKLFRRRNTRPILLATSIAVFNQLSGVNILLLYMLDILASAGIDFPVGHTYTVVISCLSLATALLGMAFVDRMGRKPLLFLGSAGMAVCLFTLGLTIPRHFSALLYMSIFVAYNACFAFSQGTVVWVYLSELFPRGLRGVGQGYGSSVHWIANAILTTVFPSVQHASSAGVFYVFAVMMVLQIVVISLWYPETRGRALGSLPQQKDRRA
jgi:MFS family permease